MIKTNRKHLVIQSVHGKIHSPSIGGSAYRISNTGEPMILPATGGITYNYAIGDNCMDLVGDHVEPGVSVQNPDTGENGALNILSCIGNEAKVISGDAKGDIGYVTGTHGGIEHVLVYFDDKTLDKLSIDDRIQIKAHGQGFQMEDLKHIHIMNLDPNLFDKMGVKLIDEDSIEVPVVTEIPGHMMGSGIGSPTASRGDYDIMTGDPEANKKYGIDKLRFGDLVLLNDCDNTYGRQFLKGSVTVGVVVHSNCIISGHGPGVTGLFSCKTSNIKGRIDKDANIANLLGIK